MSPRTRRRPHRTTPELAEFRRIQQRLGWALLTMGVVVAVGVIGFSMIGGEEYSIIDAVYMTVITLTTVGYGEIIDLSASPGGRVFTMALLLGGMGVVAYTLSLLGAFVMEGQIRNVFARRRMDRQIGKMAEHFIVCGDTAAAWYVAEELKRSRRPFVLVAPTEGAMTEAYERLGDVPRVVGDPSDDDVLLDAGIDRATGVVVCMESDKDNVLVALTARRLAASARIVASTESRETESKLRAAGADAIVSPSHIGGLRMASELVRPRVVSFLDSMLRDPRTSLRVEEVTVPPDAAAVGRTLGSLQIGDTDGALLLALRDSKTGSFTFKPPASTPLEAGTTLVLMVDADGRSQIEQRLRT